MLCYLVPSLHYLFKLLLHVNFVKGNSDFGARFFNFLGKIGDCKTFLELKCFLKINLNSLCIARDLSINNFLSPESAKSTEKSRGLQPLLAQHLRKMLILRLKIGSSFYVWSLYIVRTFVGSFSVWDGLGSKNMCNICGTAE